MRWLVGAVVVGACGAPAATPLDAGGDAGLDASAFPAPHHDEPQLVTEGGIMPTPVIVPITFLGDAYRTDIETFSAALGASSYWTAIAAPYGIAAIGAATPIHLATPAPAMTDEATIKTWLASQLDGTHPDWGAPDPNKIYSVFYPKTTQLNLALAGRTCIDNAGGFHDSIVVGGVEVVYSVVVECDAGIDGAMLLDALTVGFSHELIEAATDPLGTGWYVDPSDYAVLAFADSGEIADLCEFTGVWFKPADLGYGVTRAWSNAAGTSGHSPCVPAIASPYFNSAPVVGDTVHLAFAGYDFATTGIKLGLHERATVELDLFSDAEVGPWSVSAKDREALSGKPPTLAFTFDRTTGVNGDKLAMTIEVLAIDPAFQSEPFVILSQTGNSIHTWFSIVGQ